MIHNYGKILINMTNKKMRVAFRISSSKGIGLSIAKLLDPKGINVI